MYVHTVVGVAVSVIVLTLLVTDESTNEADKKAFNDYWVFKLHRRRYGRYDDLHKRSISKETREEIMAEVFQTIDSNADGILDHNELKEDLKRNKRAAYDSMSANWMRDADRDNDQKLDFHEFLKLNHMEDPHLD